MAAGFRLCLAAVLVCPLSAIAGSDFPDLHTDRDAFTPSTRTVAPAAPLVETSYVYIDNPVGFPTNNYPELLLRVGTNDWFEWRLGVNYGVGSQGNVVTSVEVGDGTLDGSTLYETSILYGCKVKTSAQAGLRPDSCLIVEATTPAYGNVFGTSPVATFVTGWELPMGFATAGEELWRIDAAIRYAYAEGLVDWFSRWTPSVVMRMPVTDRWEIHGEWFGNYTSGLTDNTVTPFFSPGTHYMLTKHVEIGLRVGWGLTADAAPFFSDAGLAVRW